MRLAAVQLAPAPGDLERNLEEHLGWIEAALGEGAELVCFPELSLTGYEPKLARGLALEPEDARLEVLQECCDASGALLAVGLPTVAPAGVRISMLVFRPGAERLVYSKQRLHPDELSYFVPGEEQLLLQLGGRALAPAICYESLQLEHAEQAARMGAQLYLASVAKSERGIAVARAHYPAVARRHALAVVMANCLGPCDDFVGAGRSAAWNARGEQVGELDGEREGILLYDGASGEARSLQGRRS